jgi:hypothetical protein
VKLAAAQGRGGIDQRAIRVEREAIKATQDLDLTITGMITDILIPNK